MAELVKKKTSCRSSLIMFAENTFPDGSINSIKETLEKFLFRKSIFGVMQGWVLPQTSMLLIMYLHAGSAID